MSKGSHYGKRRRWQGDGHLGKEMLEIRGSTGRRTEHIRKERAPTWHPKGRPTLGVLKGGMVGLDIYTPLHYRARLSTEDTGWFRFNSI